jgi:hypothetical protein
MVAARLCCGPVNFTCGRNGRLRQIVCAVSPRGHCEDRCRVASAAVRWAQRVLPRRCCHCWAGLRRVRAWARKVRAKLSRVCHKCGGADLFRVVARAAHLGINGRVHFRLGDGVSTPRRTKVRSWNRSTCVRTHARSLATCLALHLFRAVCVIKMRPDPSVDRTHNSGAHRCSLPQRAAPLCAAHVQRWAS